MAQNLYQNIKNTYFSDIFLRFVSSIDIEASCKVTSNSWHKEKKQAGSELGQAQYKIG